jgi:hypothetical protein
MAFERPPPLDLTPIPGEYGEWKEEWGECPHCGAHTVRYRLWESSDGAYDDYNYECTTCKQTWWIDGPDA